MLFIEAHILDHIDGEDIIVDLIQIGLIEYSPIHLQRSNACVLNLKRLRDSRHVSFSSSLAAIFRYPSCVSNNCGHWQSRWNRVVIQTDLVGRDDHWATANIYSNWEAHVRQAFDTRENVVIELSTDIVVDCNRDRNLCVRQQLALVRGKHKRNSFIIGQIESLLLLQSFCLRESISCHR